MKKLKLGVIFGGMSTENEVSVVSANSVMKRLDPKKYELFPIYIDKQGKWYKYQEDFTKTTYDGKVEKKEEITNIIQYLKQLDVIFPVLHGLYGEDGSIQGLFELLNIPYVGCKVLASSVGMDKAYTKIVFKEAGLNQAKYTYLRKRQEQYYLVEKIGTEKQKPLSELVKIIEQKQNYPMFVKPANSGSSVGIRKVKIGEELQEGIEYASQYDTKIVIEEGIKGREVECAVLGNDEIQASCIGEIKAADEFYSYEAKYTNQESKTIIPAELPENVSNEIRESAIKAFQAIDGTGLSRVDFFVEDETNRVIINEINTLPGFTSISMYPKLFEAVGISYSQLLDQLIQLALN
jgi:D-alanine-D-alanine ligase